MKDASTQEEAHERRDVNRRAWDLRTTVHLGSAYYDVDAFRGGASTLKPPELALAGDVRGLRLLHLQCHFGLDTLSWARLGAVPTGVDFSPASIRAARTLASETGLQADFICADVQLLPHFKPSFDIVVTSYGVICWLENLDAWARGIHDSLVGGGRLVLVEFHPILEIFHPGSVSGTGAYFPNQTPPLANFTTGTYASRSSTISYTEYRWQHPVCEVLGSLIAAGLTIIAYQEYAQCAYGLFDELDRCSDGMWAPRGDGSTSPYMYSVVAAKAID